MTLGREVVDFVGPDQLNDADEVGGVGQITVVEKKSLFRFVRVLVEVIDPVRVKKGGPAFDAADFIALLQQEFGELCAVLPGDAGDECFFIFLGFD